MFEETLQKGEERREVKSKGEKERYTQMNATFQRIARRNKDFLNEQCKEVEENQRMGNSRDRRDLFKTIGDMKARFMKGWAG